MVLVTVLKQFILGPCFANGNYENRLKLEKQKSANFFFQVLKLSEKVVKKIYYGLLSLLQKRAKTP